jgi:lipopolysaccharide transport system permease protein
MRSTDSSEDTQSRQASVSEERIYTPSTQMGWGFKIWREMFIELISSRELIWRLFMRDFSARYRQTILGFFWALMLPLVATFTFVLLNYSGLLKISGTGIPYPVYVMFGMTIWQTFSGGLSTCANALVSGGSIVTKINFSKEALVFSSMGIIAVDFLIRLLLLFIAMVVFQTSPKWTFFLLPIILLPIFMLTLGLGFFLTLINVIFRDTSHIVTIMTSFLIFLTPVIYPVPETGVMFWIMKYNPLTPLISASRDIVFIGHLTDASGLVWASIFSFLLFLIGWRFFHLVELRIAERI